MSVAVRNLLAERTRFALSVLGVGVAVLLILIMSGIFVGTTRQVTTYIDHSRNAVWGDAAGLSQMFKSVSWLPDDDKAAPMAVPEIASAEPILGLPSDFVRNGTHTAFFVVGYDTGTGGVRGYWRRAHRRGVGEVVLDRALAPSTTSASVTRVVRIVDEDYRGRPVQADRGGDQLHTFISLADAKRLLRAGNRVSHF